MIFIISLILIWLCIGFKAGVDLILSESDFTVEEIPAAGMFALLGPLGWLIVKCVLNGDVILIKRNPKKDK